MQMACRSAALLCLLSASLAPAAHANQALMVARRGPMPSAGGAMRLRGGSAVEPAIPAEDKSLATHAVDYALAGCGCPPIQGIFDREAGPGSAPCAEVSSVECGTALPRGRLSRDIVCM